MNWKRSLCAGLAAALLAGALAGCTAPSDVQPTPQSAKMKSGGATPEQIQQAVDNYLTENPVTAGELSLDGNTVKMTEGGN